MVIICIMMARLGKSMAVFYAICAEIQVFLDFP
jgi:hypothetical protein